MITLAFDPGPTKCGVAALCHDTRRVTLTRNGASVEECLELLATSGEFDQVAIERVQSYGISGSSLLPLGNVRGLSERSRGDEEVSGPVLQGCGARLVSPRGRRGRRAQGSLR